jgi:hypothetical protein
MSAGCVFGVINLVNLLAKSACSKTRKSVVLKHIKIAPICFNCIVEFAIRSTYNFSRQLIKAGGDT